MTRPARRRRPGPLATRRARPLAVALVSLGAAGLTACGPVDPLFRNDRRVEITAPRSQQQVSLPFTLRWSVRDFRLTGPDGGRDAGSGYFAVFVDTAPIPPGETLASIAKDDRSCLPEQGCPDERYLADRRIFTTTRPELTISELAVPDGERDDGRRHEATVVLLDGSGRRIGEGAWHVDFRLERTR